MVPPQGIEPQPLLLQSSAPTMYAREALNLLEECSIFLVPVICQTSRSKDDNELKTLAPTLMPFRVAVHHILA